MKAIMFSDSWFEKFMDSINANAEYERYASDWEGDIILSIKGDEQSHYVRSGQVRNVRLELFHGKCKSVSFPGSVEKKQGQYLLEGKASIWEGVLSGKINVVTAMLRGEIVVTGNIPKLMKYVNAAQELVKSAGRIE